MRVKSKWHKNNPKSVEEVANTAGYIACRLARATVDGMYGKGFNFGDAQSLFDSVTELSILLLQVAGTQVYHKLGESDFPKFINAMAGKIADTMTENQGEGVAATSRTGIINHLTQRLGTYSEFSFNDGEAGYPALRYLGSILTGAMAAGESRWIAEQVVEVEAPAMIRQFNRAFDELLQQFLTQADPVTSGD